MVPERVVEKMMKILNLNELPEFKTGEQIKDGRGKSFTIHGRVFCRPWLIETAPNEKARWFFGLLRLPDHLFLPQDNCQTCFGHEDADSARLSFKQYLFREHFTFHRASRPYKCAVCGELTNKAGVIFFWFDWRPVPLCTKHCTLDTAFEAFKIDDHQMVQVSPLDEPILATMCQPGGPISLTDRRGWGV